eukprot:2542821-Prymnesium_polylepis.1
MACASTRCSRRCMASHESMSRCARHNSGRGLRDSDWLTGRARSARIVAVSGRAPRHVPILPHGTQQKS